LFVLGFPVPKKKLPPAVEQALKDYMRSIASKGGKRGGVSRWAGVSAEERSRQMRALRARPVKKKKN
jgi:hypothetical protein